MKMEALFVAFLPLLVLYSFAQSSVQSPFAANADEAALLKAEADFEHARAEKARRDGFRSSPKTRPTSPPVPPSPAARRLCSSASKRIGTLTSSLNGSLLKSTRPRS